MRKRKVPKRRNPIARSLAHPSLRVRVVPNRKKKQPKWRMKDEHN